MVELVAGAMDKQAAAPGFLLDGFPANTAQARLCKERMGDPVKIIVLEIPDPVMMTRCLYSIQYQSVQSQSSLV